MDKNVCNVLLEHSGMWVNLDVFNVLEEEFIIKKASYANVLLISIGLVPNVYSALYLNILTQHKRNV